MNNLFPQFTLREWWTHMTEPVRVVALVGVAVILTVMAPFGTDELMRALPRFAYWGVLVLLSYSVGFTASLLTSHLAPGSPVGRIALSGFMTSLGVLILVFVLNELALQYWASGLTLAQLAANVFAIAFIVSAIFDVAYDTADRNAEPQAPPLLDRVPYEKRESLVALSVEDHYVRVRTVKGEAMVLMRLADAIREVGDTVGLQVHRSHWVSLDQVTAVARTGDGAVLKMSCGPEIPVSRVNVGKIREVGLL